MAELMTYLALVFDAPINGLLAISAKLSDDSGLIGTEILALVLKLMAGTCLTTDLDRGLAEYQEAREGDQPIINAYESGLEAKAHIEAQAHSYQSEKWQHDGGDDDRGGSVHNEGRI